jgi:hypothetical protein
LAVIRKLIDARPDFHPRAWLDELPPLDAFGTLIFQVVGQQLSVSARCSRAPASSSLTSAGYARAARCSRSVVRWAGRT